MSESKKNLDSLFWEINDEAKAEGKGNARLQFESLKATLSKYDDAAVEALGEVERRYRSLYQSNPEYELLHLSHGGFVNSGDDGFYMDFGSWLVAQGKELFDAFQKEGHAAVERYVRKGGFGEEDYLFESMCYAYYRL